MEATLSKITMTTLGTFLVLLVAALEVQADLIKVRASCPRFVVPYGRVREIAGGGIRSAVHVRVRCNLGYRLFGEKTPVCVKGQWSAPKPSCVKPGCSTRFTHTFKKGTVVLQNANAVARFWCEPGYRLEGDHVLTCNGKFWNASYPECRSAWTGPGDPPKVCNTTDSVQACGWTPLGYESAANAPALQLASPEERGSLYSPEYPSLWSRHPCLRANVRSRVSNASMHPEGWVFAHERCGTDVEEQSLDVVNVEEALDNWQSMAWRVRPCRQPFQIILSGLMDIHEIQLDEENSCEPPAITTTEEAPTTVVDLDMDSTLTTDVTIVVETPSSASLANSTSVRVVEPNSTAASIATSPAKTPTTPTPPWTWTTPSKASTPVLAQRITTPSVTSTHLTTPTSAKRSTAATLTYQATVIAAKWTAPTSRSTPSIRTTAVPVTPTTTKRTTTARALPTEPPTTTKRTTTFRTTPTEPPTTTKRTTTLKTTLPVTTTTTQRTTTVRTTPTEPPTTTKRTTTLKTTLPSVTTTTTKRTTTLRTTPSEPPTTTKVTRPKTAQYTSTPTTKGYFWYHRRPSSTSSSTSPTSSTPTTRRSRRPATFSVRWWSRPAQPLTTAANVTTRATTVPSSAATTRATTTTTTPTTNTGRPRTSSAVAAPDWTASREEARLVAGAAQGNATLSTSASDKHPDVKSVLLVGVLSLCAGGVLLFALLKVAAKAKGVEWRRSRRGGGAGGGGGLLRDSEACTLTSEDDLGLHFIDLQPVAVSATARSGSSSADATQSSRTSKAPRRQEAYAAVPYTMAGSANSAVFRAADNSINIGPRNGSGRHEPRAAPAVDKSRGVGTLWRGSKGRTGDRSDLTSLICDESLDFTERHPADNNL